MKRSAALVGCVSLPLLLTGCPLTDNYWLLEEGAAGALSAGADSGGGAASGGRPDATGGSGGLGGGEIASAGEADAGEAALGGGSNAGGGGASAGGGDGETAGNAAGGTSGAGGCSTICVCNNPCNAGRACDANGCKGGWVGMAQPPSALVARTKAASVAMDKSVFIWGGLDNAGNLLDDGAIYSPKTDTWTLLPKDAGTPSPRIWATAVWTGAPANKVVVYGGTNATGETVYRDGSVYDLATNAWSALPSSLSISRRSAPFGYWDGSRAVFFGGLNATNDGVAGADRFDLTSWSVAKAQGAPGPLAYPATAVDGSVLYLQGGLMNAARLDEVTSYTGSTDTWLALNKGLSGRSGAFGAWDGSRFLVWGGRDDLGLRSDGKTLSGSTWSSFITTVGAPSARMVGFRRSGWSFQIKPGVSAILGGIISLDGDDTLATNGASYDAVTAQWTAIPAWSSLQIHEFGVGVWTGEEFVLWGGRDQNLSTLLGERWAP